MTYKSAQKPTIEFMKKSPRNRKILRRKTMDKKSSISLPDL